MKKRTTVLLKSIFIIFIIITLAMFGVKGFIKLKALFPAYQKAQAEEIYEGIEKDYTYVIFENKPLVLNHYPVIQENKIYLPVDFVIQYLNPNFYWDENESTLTYTTTEDVIRMKSDDLNYFINNEPLKLDLPIIRSESGMGYIPQDLLNKFCAYNMQYNAEMDLLIIDDAKNDATYGVIGEKKISLRIRKDDRSHYILKLTAGDEVRIFEEDEDWYQVRTKEGYLGYLHKNAIVDLKTTEGIGNVPEEQKEIDNSFDGKINMVWHQVTNSAANHKVQEAMVGVSGLNVLSPTWFALDDSEGHISNLADVSYVEWAHQQGYQVWALFSNSFDSTFTHDVLSSTEKRERVIKQILAHAAIYELDGINIDFENVAKEDGIYFVQFIKELTPYLKKQGLVVSVDMYVPSAWTLHYDRTQVGAIVDYVIVMAYDEHWSNSEISGSVASIGFVEKGITDTLKEVPHEKVILGLPFYTRLWIEKEVDGERFISSKAYSMNKAYELLIENKAAIEWREDLAQYYGEYVIDDTTYKIWLEEEKSIERKLKVLQQYDLAGTSGWKLGLEKDEIWPLINSYLKE